MPVLLPRITSLTDSELETLARTVGEEQSYDKVFTQRLNLWMTNPIMREVMLCPGLGEMVTSLGEMRDLRDGTVCRRACPDSCPDSYPLILPTPEQ